MKQRTLSILLLVLVGCGGSHSGGGSSTGTARFEILPQVSGSTGFVYHVSADGTLVFGDLSAGKNPVVWDATGNASTFPSSTSLTMRSVSAVASDNVTFLGSGTRADGTIVPVLYRSATQIDELPLPSGVTTANGVGLSDDGTVALGADNAPTTYDPTASHKPFLVKSGVATFLPLPPGATTVFTRGLSGDGSTVIGLIDGKPVRWVSGGAAEVSGVSDLANGTAIYDIDLGYVSRDGKTVAGTISLGTGLPVTGTIPFRWTASGGAKALPLVSGTTFGVVRGLSGDGKTVLLRASETSTGRIPAYLWTQDAGTRAESDLFVKAGGDAATFTGEQPMALSANGRVTAGNTVYTSTDSGLASDWRLSLP